MNESCDVVAIDLPDPVLLRPVPPSEGEEDEAGQAEDEEEGEEDEGEENLLEPEPGIHVVTILEAQEHRGGSTQFPRTAGSTEVTGTAPSWNRLQG